MPPPNKLNDIRESLPPACHILAVSKLQSIEKIRELYRQGQRLFAENYVQEAMEKQNALQDLKIDWHFIGHLQTNKAKQVVGKFSLIHSVDSLKLVKVIDQIAEKNQIQQKILLQLNLAEEQTKGGISEGDLSDFLKLSQAFKHVQIVGLMTMPPLFENPEHSRKYFQKLRNLQETHQKNYPNLKELSMGTSSDYLIAAQEGSTMVRLGTILFGERSHST